MKKQKECKVGIPCGKTCIPRNNKCLSEMNEFDSTILESFKTLISKKEGRKTIAATSEDVSKKILELSQNIQTNKYKNFNDFLLRNFNEKEYNKLLLGTTGTNRDKSILLLAQIYAENMVDMSENEDANIESYQKHFIESLTQISNLYKNPDIERLLIDSASINNLDGENKDSYIDDLKSQITLGLNNSEFSRKKIREISEKGLNILNESYLKNVGNNKDFNLSNSNYAKIRVSLRNLLSNNNIISKNELNSINNIFNDKYNDDDINSVLRLLNDNIDNFDKGYKSGITFLGFAVLNKLATQNKVPDNLSEIELFKKIYTNTKKNGGRQKLYFGKVGGDENKLFYSDNPFGERISLDAEGNPIKIEKIGSNGKIKVESKKEYILPETFLIGPELNNYINEKNIKLIQGDEAIIPKYANPDTSVENLKNERNKLKKAFSSSFTEFNESTNSMDSPLINSLQKVLKKPFNGLLIKDSNDFLGMLSKLKENAPLSSNDIDGFIKKIQEAKLSDDPKKEEKLSKLFQEDYLDIMLGFGFTTIEASEYLSIGYESFVNDRSSALLDKYSGNPFPFADAAVLIPGADGNPNVLKLISVKYGGSGVPADTPALINLTNPELSNIHGSPANDQSLYKREKAILDFSDNSFKLKDGLDKNSIENRLLELQEHFNINELRNLANNGNEVAKSLLSKIDKMIDDLGNGKEISFKDLGLNSKKVKFRYHNDLIDKPSEISKEVNIENVLNKARNLNEDPNRVIEKITDLTDKELLKDHGIILTRLGEDKYEINKYYKNNDLQLSISHILIMMLAQESFNGFFKQNLGNNNFYILPGENHPDVGMVNNGINSIIPFQELMEKEIKLKFSDRTDAGPGRGSSSGIQYLLDILSIFN